VFLDGIGAVKLPPEAPSVLHELLRAPPPVSVYLPEVHVRTIILALLDQLGIDDAQAIAQAREVNARLMSAPLYRMLFFVISPERTMRHASSTWSSMHRGTQLEVHQRAPRRVEAKLTSPPKLDTELLVRMYMSGAVVAIEAAGARDVLLTLRSMRDGVSEIDVTWR
jgi:hypothetical protein